MTVVPSREECIDAAAQAYVDALAARDAMTPEDAAIAAGARTPDDVTALAARIRTERDQLFRSTA